MGSWYTDGTSKLGIVKVGNKVCKIGMPSNMGGGCELLYLLSVFRISDDELLLVLFGIKLALLFEMTPIPLPTLLLLPILFTKFKALKCVCTLSSFLYKPIKIATTPPIALTGRLNKHQIKHGIKRIANKRA